MAGKGKNKFVEAARSAHKGKVAAGTSSPPPKRACRADKIIMLPPPPPSPTTKEPSPTQLKSSSRGTPSLAPVQIEPSQKEVRNEATWLWDIQHLAMALTKTNSLLEEPQLSFLIAKNAQRLGDRHRLNAVETDELYDNIIDSTMESVLCT